MQLIVFSSIVGKNETMEYIIEKNVPYKSGKRSSWPFKNMEIGDSVFIEINEEKNTTKIIRAVHSYAASSTTKTKFKTSILNEFGQKGVRVWRIE